VSSKLSIYRIVTFRATHPVSETAPGKEHDNGNRLQAHKRTFVGSSESNVKNYRPRCNTGLLSRLDGTTYAASRPRSKNSVTNVASRMLLMVFLTQNSLSLCAEEALLPYKWLTQYSKHKCCMQLDIQRKNGPIFLTKQYILNATTRRYQI
jgi:hypothetical protein